jgi:Glycosyltransferase family 87
MPVAVVPRRSLLPWLLLASVAAGIAMTVQLAQSQQGMLRLPLYDYVAFWAAGRLNATGEDPYDPARLAALEREANPQTVDILLMWNPPWALTLLAPFVRLGPQTSHLLWQFAQLGVLLAALELLWRFYDGDPAKRWIAWLVAFTYPPTYFLLVTGQLSAIVLLGLAGFLYFLSRGREFAAGACLALASIKPQLTFLFWIALLLWSIEGRRWRVALGGVLAVFAMLVLPLWENPNLPAYYWEDLTRRTQTHSHLSPVAGTALRLLLAPRHFWLQFVPLVPGLLWLAWYWRRHRGRWDWSERLPALLFASFLAAPYGAWPFDMVVLLLPLIGRARELVNAPPRRIAIAAVAHGLIGFAALALIVQETPYFWFLWMTPALLAAYFLTGPAADGEPISSSSDAIWRARSAGGAVSS